MRLASALIRCNITGNITSNCSTWIDISGANSPSYITPVGNETLQGALIRFVANNVKGAFVSTPVQIVVTASSTR